VYYYRVRAEVAGLSSDWSAGRPVLVAPAVRWEREPVDAYVPDTLFTVQRALMRLCASRGDLLAVLTLPQHYREDETITHARALTAGDPLDDDERTRSFAALYHPWLTTPEPNDPQSYRVVPPDGAAAGVMAARAAWRGAWIAPANEMLRDVVLLAPRIRPEALAALQDAQVNVVRQEPRGFLWLAADTLSPDPELRPIGVRRLLSLLRRVALLTGAGYVFEPNDDTLRRAVQRGFEALLGQLFARGAFTGATADQAFRVVTGSPPNTPQSIDAGRLIVELKVAPSQPLAFLTVRLVQAGDGNLTVESR
jgi:phage tail sheath protein FI